MRFSQTFAATLIACAVAAPLPHSSPESRIARSLTKTLEGVSFNAGKTLTGLTGGNLVNNAAYDSTNAVNVVVDQVTDDGSDTEYLIARSSTSDVTGTLYNLEKTVSETTGGNLVNNVLFDATDSTTDTVVDVNGDVKKALKVFAIA